MSEKKSSGYQIEIPEDAVADALAAMDKYKREEECHALDERDSPNGEGIAIEVEPGPTGQAEATSGDAPERGELEAQLEQARADARKTRERMLRVAADADNQRKRLMKEREDLLKFGQEKLLREMLPIVDNLERTLAHMPENEENPAVTALREGLEMVMRQIRDLQKSHHVEPFDSIGQMFDPNRHEAISREETGRVEPGTVVNELHRGYLMHDRLLRPALVVVAAAPSQHPDGESQSEEP